MHLFSEKKEDPVLLRCSTEGVRGVGVTMHMFSKKREGLLLHCSIEGVHGEGMIMHLFL